MDQLNETDGYDIRYCAPCASTKRHIRSGGNLICSACGKIKTPISPKLKPEHTNTTGRGTTFESKLNEALETI